MTKKAVDKFIVEYMEYLLTPRYPYNPKGRITQALLAKKYGCSQATIARNLKLRALDYTSQYKQRMDQNPTESADQIAFDLGFKNASVLKLLVLYAIRSISSTEYDRREMIFRMNLQNFAKSIQPTKAHNYGLL